MLRLLLLAGIALTQAQQQTPKARVEGVVLRAGSNEPVVGARVTLSRPDELNTSTTSSTTNSGSSLNLFRVPTVPTLTGNAPPTPPVIPPLPIPPVFTDNSGKFAISEVDTGTYRLIVNLDGFVRQEYGQRTFPGQGTSLTINPGDVLKDLTVRLTQAGNVGGRIVDNLGKPAVAVPLQLLRAVYNQYGQRTFQNAGTARTNDRGEYRFYWITPGRLYLAGGTPQGTPAAPGSGAGSPNESGDSYTFTYYPGVQDVSRATVIEVRPGAEVVADFMVPRQQLYTIRGRIVDPSSALPPASASIALAYQQLTGGNAMFSRNPIYNAATGAFELRDVLPGPYLLFANTLGGAARTSVEVVNANIEGVLLTVNAGINIIGHIAVEGGGPSPTAARAQLRPMVEGSPTLVGNLPGIEDVAPDGTFVVHNVLPGLYRIAPPALPEFYARQMRLDGIDALNQPVEVTQRGQDFPTLDILLSPNVSQIEGTVTDARMQPVPGVRVVLIPGANRDRAELYKTATADQAGRFTIRGVAPGDYKLFAWENLEGNGYFDTDFLRRSESSGKPVRVTESSKQSANLQVIPGN